MISGDDICNKTRIKNISNDIENKDEKYNSSDEEDIRNTVGKIPMKWYDEYDHIGYDWESNKIPKPKKGDELDNFLESKENPNFWRTLKDPQTTQDILLNAEDIDLILKSRESKKLPDSSFDEYMVS